MIDDEQNENLKFMKVLPKERTNAQNLRILSILKTLKPLIDYLDEPIKKELDMILFKLAENITYLELPKGSTLKKLGDEDSFFYILLKGKVAQLSIRYSKIFLSIKEYFIHLMKLQILQENFLLRECLTKNKKICNIPSDPITYCKNLKDFKFEKYFNKLKKSIISNEWFHHYDINEFLKLINFKKKIKNVKTEKDISKEPEYSFIIPEYVFNKFINNGYFIDTLTEPKHVKELYSYITVKRSKFGCLDKYNIKNLDYYKTIHSNQKEYLENLFKDLFIFQGVNTNFIMDNFSSFFEYKLVKKGDFIIKQDSPHYGIFLIKNGKFEVKTRRTINEIDYIIHSLNHSLDNFHNYISDFKCKTSEKDKKINFTNKNISNPVFSSSEFISLLNKKKDFFLILVEKKQIIGFNDFYDYKSGNNLFNVECVSEEGEIFFVPNTIVNSLINSSEIIHHKIALRVEERAKYFIENLIRQKEKFEKETGELLRQKFAKTPIIKFRIFSGVNKINKSNNSKFRLITRYYDKKKNNNELLTSNRKIKDRMEQVSLNFNSFNNIYLDDINNKSTINSNNHKLLNITDLIKKKNKTFRLMSSKEKSYFKIGNMNKNLFLNSNNMKDYRIITSYSNSKRLKSGTISYK